MYIPLLSNTYWVHTIRQIIIPHICHPSESYGQKQYAALRQQLLFGRTEQESQDTGTQTKKISSSPNRPCRSVVVQKDISSVYFLGNWIQISKSTVVRYDALCIAVIKFLPSTQNSDRESRSTICGRRDRLSDNGDNGGAVWFVSQCL